MIDKIQTMILERKRDVNDWLAQKRKGLRMPIYASFDIRDNDMKAVVVDANAYPSGFNNLPENALQGAVRNLRSYLEGIRAEKTVLLYPEEHTRNRYYLSNLNTLRKVFRQAGYTLIFGTPHDEIAETSLRDSNDEGITFEKIERKNNKLITRSFHGKVIVLNNPLSREDDHIFRGVEQTLLPSPALGWLYRKKSNHFRQARELAEEFAAAFGIDPWFITTHYDEVDDVDFKTGKGMDRVAAKVDSIIAEIRRKYRQHGIHDEPVVFVKDNAGKYGRGIITLTSSRDVYSLNYDMRKEMSRGSQNVRISSVILQEGVRTHYRIDGSVAEPVIYTMGGEVIGGFSRLHREKDDIKNLNAPGMQFDLLLENEISKPLHDCIKDDCVVSLYGVLATIGLIAIAHEEREQEERGLP